jgi:hypothetical protein
MKFIRILQKVFLDTVSVPIFVVRSGVRLISDRLRVLSVDVMRSRRCGWHGGPAIGDALAFELLPLLG